VSERAQPTTQPVGADGRREPRAAQPCRTQGDERALARAGSSAREQGAELGDAAGGADQPPDLVPPAGFEPAISTLKGWRPRPLDDGGLQSRASVRQVFQTIVASAVNVRHPIAIRPAKPRMIARASARPARARDAARHISTSDPIAIAAKHAPST